MKVLKILAAIVVTLVVLLAVVVVLALMPAVQTWAVRKAVAGQPGIQLQVRRVAAGFSSATIDDLHVVKDGMTVTAHQVTAAYSAWAYLLHRRLVVDALTTDGLVIDLRNPAATATHPPRGPNGPSAAAPTPAKDQPSAPFNGVLHQLQLPVDLRVARFSVPGRALLPHDRTATFELKGSDIATGEKGTLDWKVDLTNAQPKSAVQAAHTSGTAHVHITTERRIDALDANALASVEGAGLPADQFRVEFTAEQPAAGGNEGYDAKILLVHGGAAEPLATVAAQFDATRHAIAGAWNVTIRREQVAELLGGLGLPDLAATGAGKFSLQPDSGAVAADGEMHGRVQHLEKISSALASIGTLNFQTSFDGGLANDAAHLEQFGLEATGADGRRLAEIRALQRMGFSLADKRVTFADANANLARIAVQSLPLAWAQPFLKGMTIESGDLSLELAVAAAADGSRITVTAPGPVTARNVTVRQGQQTMLERLAFTARPRVVYADDGLHAELPDVDASMPTGDTLHGNFTVDIAHLSGARTIAFTAQTEAHVVSALKPYLPDSAGPLVVTTRSKGSMAGSRLEFAESASTVARPSGATLLRFDLLQPLSVDLQQGTIAAARADSPTARVAVSGVPLSWANKLASNATLDGELSGGTIELTIRSADDLAVKTTTPLALRGVSASLQGEPMLDRVDVACDASGTKHGDAITYDVRQFQITRGAATLAKLTVAGDATLAKQPAYSAKGNFAADAAALFQQPAVAAYGSLARGDITATFDAKVTNSIQANASIQARNLVAKEDNRPLGDAALNVTAAVQPDGSSVVTIPFTLTNGTRKSDVSLEGKIARTGNTLTFDGQLTSNDLFVQDLQPLAALAPAAKPVPAGRGATPVPNPGTARPTLPVAAGTGAPSIPATTATRDTKAAWSGVAGQFRANLRRITIRPDYIVTDVRATAAVTPTQLTLTSLDGKLDDKPFKLKATTTFDAQKTDAYALTSAANFANIDVGAILQAANPSEKPALESLVSIDAKIESRAPTIPDLLQRATGSFDVKGSKGVLRALARKEGAVSNAVNVGSALLGALNGAIAQKSAGAAALVDLTRKLAALPFDSFTMQAERGADLNINVTRLEFLSSDTRLTGTGTITNQPGVPIQNQPMHLQLQLAGKDDMAVLLDRVHLLGTQQDDRGYQLMSTAFNVTGTPAKPDSSDYWRIATQVALRSGLGDQLQHYLGGGR